MREVSALQKLVEVSGKMVLTVVLFALLMFTIPLIQGQPAQPELISPENSENINDNTPFMDWEPVSGADNYHLQIDDDNDFTSPNVDADNIQEDNYQVPEDNTLPDGVYYWRVRGENADGPSPWSDTWIFRVDTLPPSAPILVLPENNESISDNTPRLEWNPVDENSKPVLYRVHVSDDPQFSYDNWVSDWITAENWVVTLELPDGTWYWCVEAKDNTGNIGENSPWYLFKVDTVPPSISDVDAKNITTSSATIEWTTDEPASSVVEYWMNGGWRSSSDSFLVTHHSVSLVDLSPATTYPYRVKSTDAAGNATTSTGQEFTTESPGTETPGGSARIVLWSYDYDGENLEIELKNVGDTETEVLLSLRDSNGILIGVPFYHEKEIGAGDVKTSTFKLQENFSTVKVFFEYDGQQVTETIPLGSTTLTSPEVSISTPSPSVHVEIGRTTSYQIVLTNEGGEGYVKFIVSELPESIDPIFYDGTRVVSGVTLAEEEYRTLDLYLSLPSSATDFELDEVIDFVVFALDENQFAEYENGTSLDDLEAPSLELQLTVEGVAELDLSLDNVFARVNAGEELHITATVANTGALTAEDVELEVTDLPYGWSAFANPDTIPSIDPDGEVEVDVTVVLPEDAAPGRYEFSISASDGDQEASKDFEARVEEVGGGSQILWILALMFVFVVVAGVMVKFGRR